MGLSLTVGVLGDCADAEDVEFITAQFDELNGYLAAAGLRAHSEPATLPPGLPVSYDMPGYSGLHTLRRLAVLIATGGKLSPAPAGADSSKDALVASIYAECDWTVNSNGVRFFHSKRRFLKPSFDHLLFHSDADGYYLPQRFRDVLLTWQEGEKYTSAVGSSFTLKTELETIAKAIRLPLDLDPESEEVYAALDSPDTRARDWRRYGTESFCCLRLHRACTLSVEHGAAVVFG
jgi:hypothetical protein